ncbi:MAG: hypothetical protein ACI92Z_000648 [Paracoccaceae bacterium]|jgi:hypothetical protein
MTDMFKTLDRFARTKLIGGLTPLERLSTHLDIDLWIKRDDLTGLVQAATRSASSSSILAMRWPKGLIPF